MPKDDWLQLAILYDKHALYSPSNSDAIDKFLECSERQRVAGTILEKEKINLLYEYDCLFIRDTTHPSNHTFEFAINAESLGMPTLDSTYSILVGSNKIWQTDTFIRKRISHPRTKIITYEGAGHNFSYPLVIKIHDSCFSQGIYVANDRIEYEFILNMLFTEKKVNTLLLQEFIKTDFDWRIGVLNNSLIFACKYFMIDNDWKIIKYDRNGDYIYGKHEYVPVEKVPEHVINLAIKCAKLLDDGLYGIDIKETKDNCYVIEINDNPNIDFGVEDGNSDHLYNLIISWFKEKHIQKQPKNTINKYKIVLQNLSFR